VAAIAIEITEGQAVGGHHLGDSLAGLFDVAAGGDLPAPPRPSGRALHLGRRRACQTCLVTQHGRSRSSTTCFERPELVAWATGIPLLSGVTSCPAAGLSRYRKPMRVLFALLISALLDHCFSPPCARSDIAGLTLCGQKPPVFRSAPVPPLPPRPRPFTNYGQALCGADGLPV